MAARYRYGPFLGLISLISLALVLLGWWPTRHWLGDAALPALIAGCAVSLVASAAGALVVLRGGLRGAAVVSATLAAMGLRLLVLVALAGALLAAQAVPARPFLLWLAISYLALLVADTRLMQGLTER